MDCYSIIKSIVSIWGTCKKIGKYLSVRLWIKYVRIYSIVNISLSRTWSKVSGPKPRMSMNSSRLSLCWCPRKSERVWTWVALITIWSTPRGRWWRGNWGKSKPISSWGQPRTTKTKKINKWRTMILSLRLGRLGKINRNSINYMLFVIAAVWLSTEPRWNSAIDVRITFVTSVRLGNLPTPTLIWLSSRKHSSVLTAMKLVDARNVKTKSARRKRRKKLGGKELAGISIVFSHVSTVVL